jgi:hypothetical protein
MSNGNVALSYKVQLTEGDVFQYVLHEMYSRKRKVKRKSTSRILLRVLAALALAAYFLIDGDYVGAIVYPLLYVMLTWFLGGFGNGSLLMNSSGTQRPFFQKWLKNRLHKGFEKKKNAWLLQPMEIKISKDSIWAITATESKSIPLSELRSNETIEYFFFTGSKQLFFILPKRFVHDADAVSKWLGG